MKLENTERIEIELRGGPMDGSRRFIYVPCEGALSPPLRDQIDDVKYCGIPHGIEEYSATGEFTEDGIEIWEMTSRGSVDKDGREELYFDKARMSDGEVDAGRKKHGETEIEALVDRWLEKLCGINDNT